MDPSSTNSYRRFVYWIQDSSLAQHLDRLKRQNKQIHRARNQPCEALYSRRDVVTVAPEVWSRRCARQGSWYRHSAFQGFHLIVSGDPLEELAPCTTISIREFAPARLADRSCVIDLLSDPRISEAIPPGWGLFTDWELGAIEQHLGSERLAMPIQELFCHYTANHVNFLFPQLFIEEDGQIVPYSIQVPALVCSACVELFGIVGLAFRKKYVAPCPGLKYMRPPPGSYFLVETAHEYWNGDALSR